MKDVVSRSCVVFNRANRLVVACYESPSYTGERPHAPTTEQIEAYQRDGFLVVEQFMAGRRARARARALRARVRARVGDGARARRGQLHPGVTPPDRTRQLCNVWKADRTLAATTLARAQRASSPRALAGRAGHAARPGQRDLEAAVGQGAARATRTRRTWTASSPKNMTTCWIALDDTAADTGTIYYVRGSHRWPRPRRTGGTFHAPDDWLGHLREVAPDGAEVELVPIEVPAGGAAFHDGWTFHGSPPNERADARAALDHLAPRDDRDRVERRRHAAPALLAATGDRASASSTRRSSPWSGAPTATAAP